MTADRAPAIVVSNARLRRRTAARLGLDPAIHVDLVIRDGRYESIVPAGTRAGGADAERTIDAAGALVTESFVNGHLHLCKVNTLDFVGDAALAAYHGAGMGGAMTAIELAAKVKELYRTDRLLPGIRAAFDRAVRYGTTHIRAFADTDTTARQEGVRAVMPGCARSRRSRARRSAAAGTAGSPPSTRAR